VLVAQAVLFTSVGLVVLGLLLVPAQEWRLTLEFVLEVAGNSLFILACSAVGVWAMAGATVVVVVATTLIPGPIASFPRLQNPLGVLPVPARRWI
jgi:hypothetical protein